MLGSLISSGLKAALSLPALALRFGIKPIKYFIDSHFRAHAVPVPVPGSVVYSDLWFAAEHSGIYTGNGLIANIEVSGLAESVVRLSGPAGFTDKSKLGRKIYVSCNSRGAVGSSEVAEGAKDHVDEQSFYGLLFSNCHRFSSKCVHYSPRTPSAGQTFTNLLPSFDAKGEWTIRQLKTDARNKLDAGKWRLWDWNQQAKNEPESNWPAAKTMSRKSAIKTSPLRCTASCVPLPKTWKP